MNQKVLLLIGLTIIAVMFYVFVVVNGRHSNQMVPASTITVILFVALTALVIVWKPDPPA